VGDYDGSWVFSLPSRQEESFHDERLEGVAKMFKEQPKPAIMAPRAPAIPKAVPAQPANIIPDIVVTPPAIVAPRIAVAPPAPNTGLPRPKAPRRGKGVKRLTEVRKKADQKVVQPERNVGRRPVTRSQRKLRSS
jgi:hypothetical protein